MARNGKSRIAFLLISLVFASFIIFFYLKYVPLVKTFQLILLPVLLTLFLLTAINIRWGILGFVFFFPLINNLPYFFNIFENIPHAPTALVLFLFFFLGWLVHNIFFESELSFRYTITKPLIIFSLFIFISLVITIFRYANFFPFLSDQVYELVTNVNGVTAGGAIMSAIFFSLNYITGFILFFIVLSVSRSQNFIKKTIIVLLICSFISILFGIFQNFVDINIGNMPVRASHNTLNATFKDPLSFGVYLSIVIPLFISSILLFKKYFKIIAFLVVLSAFFILPSTGSLSGLFGVILSLAIFLFLVLKIAFDLKKSKPEEFRKIISIGIVFLIICIIFSGLLVYKDTKSLTKLRMRVSILENGRDWGLFSSSRSSYFWKMAAYMMWDYPLTGVGVGSYIIELPNYAKINHEKLRISDSAENYFFQVGSELGILGLFFSIWIFWEIFRQIGKTLKSIAIDNKWRFIAAGISASLVSFFFSSISHTFIGSYEIKYIFWLLTGLLFALVEESQEKVQFGNKFKIFSVILVILFGGFHLWNSSHSLSLKARSERVELKQYFGLYQLEETEEKKTFRWTRDYGGLMMRIEKPVIQIPLIASHPDIEINPVKVKIYLVKDFFKIKVLLDEIILTKSEWETVEFSIPEEIGKEIILLFKVNRTWNPQKVLGTPDPRNLGVAIGKIEFKKESSD